MNIMNQVTWRSMWRNRTRTIVTIVGIILSAAMFTAVTTLGVSLVDYLIRATIWNSGDYFIQYDYATDAQRDALHQEASVTKIGDLSILGYTTFDDPVSPETCIVAAGDQNFFDMVTIRLEEGRLPENGDEIVINRNSHYYLRDLGLPCEVGGIITLDVVPEYADDSIGLPSGGAAFTKSYVIVGIAELTVELGDWDLDMSHLLTFAGEGNTALWHRLFAKTSPATAVYDIQGRQFGMASSTNYQLLNLYGASKYVNYNTFIYQICGVLMAIILLGSVSLIYNAFSISVSERTRQFGLLSSIGATKKQLRRSVYFEALSLCAIGIPIGVLCGYFGIAVTLYLIHGLISGLLAGTTQSGIEIYAVASPPAFVCAGLVAMLTVLLSARIPARRATKISPIAAIRQTQDYQVPRRPVKTGPLNAKLFGLPGLMARKYYAVSKKKYRATVISLTISIVLFLTSVSFGQVLQSTAELNANNYNFDIHIWSPDEAQIAAVRNNETIAKSALRTHTQHMALIPLEAYSEDYLQDWTTATESGIYTNEDLSTMSVTIYYLEDAVFRAYLEDHDIDPAPYFDPEAPTALVCSSRMTVYDLQDSGDSVRTVLESQVFADQTQAIDLYPSDPPSEVVSYVESQIGGWYHQAEQAQDAGGNPVLVWRFIPTSIPEGHAGIADPYADENCLFVTARRTEDGTGSARFDYYLWDPGAREITGQPIASEPGSDTGIRLGAAVSELPYGVSDHSDSFAIALVRPLSMAASTEELDVVLSVADYRAAVAYLDGLGANYIDHLSNQMQYRDLTTMINVFCYGFIILISLICVCNVFNTISTNIALRRRDFGMLRSVGMTQRELYRMMVFECLRYGVKALCFGLPLGLAVGYGIGMLTASIGSSGYEFPLGAVGIAAGAVFVVVFITMLYAVSKLRKDAPIDAIRMENL